MNIIFMGTPDFAVPTLEKLISSDHNVKAIFTQRPKPKGRGMEVQKSPIHLLAEKHGIEIYTPSSLRKPYLYNKAEEIMPYDLINSIEADIIVVAAYGFIIPKNILESKKYGCINLHPSKLPRFRGAAPLQHTIIEGDKESAICVIQMDEGMDTGPILIQEDFVLPERASLKWLHDYCGERGAELVLSAIDNYDIIRAEPQSQEGVVLSPKLSKSDKYLDLNEDAIKIDNKIRGYAAGPGSFIKTSIGDIKIIEAEPIILDHNFFAGKFIDAKDFILSCGKNVLKINRLQLPDRKPITAVDFLNGYNKSEIIINL